MNERKEQIKERLRAKTVLYSEDTPRDIEVAIEELKTDGWAGCMCILYANAPTDLSYLLDQLTTTQQENEKLKADLCLTGSCKVCKNKTTWCEQNPDKCKGWKWRGMEAVKSESYHPDEFRM